MLHGLVRLDHVDVARCAATTDHYDRAPLLNTNGVRLRVLFATSAMRVSPMAGIGCNYLVLPIDYGINQKGGIDHARCFFHILVHCISIQESGSNSCPLAQSAEIERKQMICAGRSR